MATRPFFISNSDETILVTKREVSFTWHPGFSVTQKQKSINSFHNEIRKIKVNNIFLNPLEVSTKSSSDFGKSLSAFNLKIFHSEYGFVYLESAYQSSKIFENGDNYNDILLKMPIDAKRDLRIKDSGNVIKFVFDGIIFPTTPVSLFYDWLYIRSLQFIDNIAEQIAIYNSFTDIEFNPIYSWNTQARSIALFRGFNYRNILEPWKLTFEQFSAIAFPILPTNLRLNI